MYIDDVRQRTIGNENPRPSFLDAFERRVRRYVAEGGKLGRRGFKSRADLTHAHCTFMQVVNTNVHRESDGAGWEVRKEGKKIEKEDCTFPSVQRPENNDVTECMSEGRKGIYIHILK